MSIITDVSTISATFAIDATDSAAWETRVAAMADEHASASVFDDYNPAANTIKAQLSDLRAFAAFLATLRIDRTSEQLQTDAAAWAFLTHGIVKAFRNFCAQQGFATATINRRLATIKRYSRLAYDSGQMTLDAYERIQVVRGYNGREARRLDERRAENGTATRVSAKKSENVKLNAHDANQLKFQPNTPQGRRDAVLMAILLDHGLRAGELAALPIENFDLGARTFRLERPKVGMVGNKAQTHKLSRDAERALRAYIDAGDAPDNGPLLRSSRKGGELTESRMTRFAITRRVRDLGAALGIEQLSAHDCRHAWATRAARMGTTINDLRDAGGWASFAMPERYIDAGKIANERVIL